MKLNVGIHFTSQGHNFYFQYYKNCEISTNLNHLLNERGYNTHWIDTWIENCNNHDLVNNLIMLNSNNPH